jgi:hypothetical protein
MEVLSFFTLPTKTQSFPFLFSHLNPTHSSTLPQGNTLVSPPFVESTKTE